MAEPIARIHSDGYWTATQGFKEPLNFASMDVYAAPQPPTANDPSSKWPFEQPHVARDLLARLYVTIGRVRDAKLEAEIDVFLAATRRP